MTDRGMKSLNTQIKAHQHRSQPASTRGKSPSGDVEHFDVVIVGAGISGIGGAYHLTKQCPDTSYRNSKNSGKLWRHLADPSLSRDPFR